MTTEGTNPKPQPLWPMPRVLFVIGLFFLFVLRAALVWPHALDFRNFAFRDLGSFQNVDQLIKEGLRPSVDFGFLYGLLGLLVQKAYFALFGTGHWTTLGFLGVYLLLVILFWDLLNRELGYSWLNFAILVGLSSMITGIVSSIPTPSHALLRLFLIFSLYFSLKGKNALALALAMVGSLFVPSLPIILSGLLALVILCQWWTCSHRSIRSLLAQFVPAAVSYAVAVLVLIGFYGARSVIPSLLPLQGAAHYKAMNYGFFTKGGGYSGRAFWDPPDPTLGYYLYSKSGIWLLCSALLVGFAGMAAFQLFRSRKIAGAPLFIILCCLLHLFFVFFAFGNKGSSVYYEMILVAGILAGITLLQSRRWQIAIATALVVLGLLSERTELGEQKLVWKTWSKSADTANLYAPNDFHPEWKAILALAAQRNLFLVSYGTGVSHYFPQIATAPSWFFLPKSVLPPEDAYVLKHIQDADVVVEYIGAPTLYIDGNAEWQAALQQFPIKMRGQYFRIWMRSEQDGAGILDGTDFKSQ